MSYKFGACRPAVRRQVISRKAYYPFNQGRNQSLPGQIALFFAPYCLLFILCFLLFVPRSYAQVKDEGLDVRVREFFYQGLQQKMVQNYQLASDYFRQVANLDKQNDAAYFELANIAMIQDKYAQAEGYIRQAVTIKPNNKWYWRMLADIYRDTKNYAQLLPVFDELIRLEEYNPDYYFDKASTLNMLKKPDDAEKIYQQIEDKFGPSEDLTEARQASSISSGNTAKATTELEKLIVEHPDNIKNYLLLAEIYTKSGERDKALVVLQKARTKEPGNALVLLSMADVYRASNRFDEAFTYIKMAFDDERLDFEQKLRIVSSFIPLFTQDKPRAQAEELGAILIKNYPAEAEGWSLYGFILTQQKKNQEAIAAYRKAVELDEQIYRNWEVLIRAEMMENLFADAVKDGESALLIFPNQAALYLLTGIANHQLKQYNKSIEFLLIASDLAAGDQQLTADIYSALGDAYHSVNKHPQSDDAYDRSLKASPDNAFVLNNYAYYLSLRGEQLEKAELMAKKANEIAPGTASFEDTYAWVLFKQKKYADAKKWIEKALKTSNSTSATQLEHYGDILFHLGQADGAVKQWNRARAAGAGSEILNRKINEKKYFE